MSERFVTFIFLFLIIYNYFYFRPLNLVNDVIVPRKRLELLLYCYNWILNPTRLPIPPPRPKQILQKLGNLYLKPVAPLHQLLYIILKISKATVLSNTRWY